jgi:Flp pilus assembly protein TadG
MRRFTDLLQRFRRDERGAFAVIFGLLAIVLIATSGAVVDFTYTQTARSRAQTALDSAALALQSRISIDDNATLKSKAQSIVRERLNDSSITATVNTATVDTTAGKLAFQASVTVPTAFVQLVGIRSITAQLTSEVKQGSTNLEVSVALDTTGSMGMDNWGNPDPAKINALIGATNNLIDLIVKDTQTPTYTKMALVPYSYGVNVGPNATYATVVRGTPVTMTAAINGGSWAVASSTKTITSVAVVGGGTVTITSTAHGLVTGDYAYISGMTASGFNSSAVTNLNNTPYKVTRTGANTFTLTGITGSRTKSGTGGSLTKCVRANCDVNVTSSSKFGSFATGDGVYLTGMTGLTNLNNTGYFITKVDSSNIVLLNSFASGGQTTTTFTGTMTRANYGDVYNHFNTLAGGENTFPVSNCVVERTSANQYTDAAPSTTYLGMMYPSSSTNCVSQTIMPLSSTKADLHAEVNALTAAGSTAGHIGLAWAWYMLAPNFSSLWPTINRPSAYHAANTLKALILMTDGQFNTQYCKGVIAQDSSNIDGSSNMIACDAPNGSSVSQAQELCTAIKNSATGIILYTVGFDIGSTSAQDVAARTFLSGCATDTDHFYQADAASDLDDAFTSIAQNLNKLRISH